MGILRCVWNQLLNLSIFSIFCLRLLEHLYSSDELFGRAHPRPLAQPPRTYPRVLLPREVQTLSQMLPEKRQCNRVFAPEKARRWLCPCLYYIYARSIQSILGYHSGGSLAS